MVKAMEVTFRQAKTQLGKLLKRVAAGEEVTITKAGIPVAKLVAVQSKSTPRALGTAKGSFVSPGDFDDPWPEFEKDFYG
jgi:prevent-host-death family protein